MRAELDLAQRAGSASEIADLSLLISNAERRAGTPKLDGVGPAANRQAQRRYNRERTYDQNSARNPHRRLPTVGDYVRVPSGQVWLVTHVIGDMIRNDLGPDSPYNSCPIALCTIVDAPVQAPEAPDGRFQACETLYQAIWDAYEVQSWDGLERALRAYEATLASLGT
jgi:hypothetical protein